MKKNFYTKKLFISIALFLTVAFQSTAYSQDYLLKDYEFNGNQGTTNSAAYAIEALNDADNKGKVMVGGFFNYYNGVEVPGKVVRLLPDGRIDPSFQAPPLSSRSGDLGGGGIYTLTVQPWDGKTVIGGIFTIVTPSKTYRNIARLNVDGSLDESFNPTGGGTTGGEAGDGKITKILALDPEKQLVVGGLFGNYKGTAIGGGRGGVIIVREDGALVRDANVTSTTDTWTGEGVYNMSLAPDGKIVIGGEFGMVGGVHCRRVARLNRDGSFDYTWTNRGHLGIGPSNSVFATAVQPDGKILIGGPFEEYAENALYWPVSYPRIRIARLNVDGTLDRTFNYDDVTKKFLSIGFNEEETEAQIGRGSASNYHIDNFLLDGDGNIYVGGTFTTYNKKSAPHFIRLKPDGAMDPDFVSYNFDNRVQQMAFQNWESDGTFKPERHLLAVGNFTSYHSIGSQPFTMRFIFADEPPPVPLASVSSDFRLVKLSSGSNKLTWKALQAATTYIVERSIDGRTFQKIATYFNAEAGKYLSHTDNYSGSGRVYYRIGAVTGASLANGTQPTEYSSILSVLSSGALASNLQVLPNEIKLMITSAATVNEQFNIQVISMGGQQLVAKQFTMNGKVLEQKIPVSQSMKHNLIIVTNGKGEVLNKVLIK